jgi:hypothetical protein
VLDHNVVSLALGRDGTLYDLQANGQLRKSTGSGFVLINSGITSFVLAPATGMLYALTTAGQVTASSGTGWQSLPNITGGISSIWVAPTSGLLTAKANNGHTYAYNPGSNTWVLIQ